MDYIRIQLFQIGVNPAPQFNTAPAIVFYFQRMLRTDPVLLALAAAALPGLLRVLRERSSLSTLALVSWMLVAGAALLAFRAENLPYLAFLIPALAVAASLGAPSVIARRMGIATAVLVAVMGVKAVAGGHPWSLRFGSAPPLPAASDLSWYCRQHRNNDLLLIEPDDEFSSATLALARVRYVVFDPAGDVSRSAPHYAPLGITVTTDQFLELDRWLPVFRLRLHEWGSPSTQAVATAIIARSQEDEVRLVKALPDADFYLSTNLLRRLPAEAALAHSLVTLSGERCFLLAQRPVQHDVVRLPGPCAW